MIHIYQLFVIIRSQEVGPLQLVIHMVQNRHVGQQGTRWEKTNRKLTSFKMVISFICLLPVYLLLSIMAVL